MQIKNKRYQLSCINLYQLIKGKLHKKSFSALMKTNKHKKQVKMQ